MHPNGLPMDGSSGSTVIGELTSPSTGAESRGAANGDSGAETEPIAIAHTQKPSTRGDTSPHDTHSESDEDG